MIERGDGSRDETQDDLIPGPIQEFALEHIYSDVAQDTSYTITVTVTPYGGATVTETRFIMVRDIPHDFMIGVGKEDITDGAKNIGLQGFSVSDQKTNGGPYQRIYARAFFIEERFDPSKRVAMVSTDNWAATDRVKRNVIRRLRNDEEGEQMQLNQKNFMLMASHAHSAPGGYSDHELYETAVGGFDNHNFECIVQGIIEALKQAFRNRDYGDIFINVQDIRDESGGNVMKVGQQRSAGAYEANPKEERVSYDSDVDHRMFLLKLTHGQTPVGMINWYALHPTSLVRGKTSFLFRGVIPFYFSTA